MASPSHGRSARACALPPQDKRGFNRNRRLYLLSFRGLHAIAASGNPLGQLRKSPMAACRPGPYDDSIVNPQPEVPVRVDPGRLENLSKCEDCKSIKV